MREKDILKPFKEYLILQEKFGHLTFNRIHTGGIVFPSRSKSKLIPNLDMKGFSDIHILAKGNAAYLELKATDGILSEAQRDFLLLKKKHGGKCGVVGTFDDAVAFTEALIRGDMSSVGI